MKHETPLVNALTACMDGARWERFEYPFALGFPQFHLKFGLFILLIVLGFPAGYADEEANPCNSEWEETITCSHGSVKSAGTYSGPPVVRICHTQQNPSGQLPAAFATGVTFNKGTKTTTYIDIKCDKTKDPDEDDINYSAVFKWSPNPQTYNFTPGEHTFHLMVGGKGGGAACDSCEDSPSGTPCSDVGWKTAEGSLKVRVIKIMITTGGDLRIQQDELQHTQILNVVVQPPDVEVEWGLLAKPDCVEYTTQATSIELRYVQNYGFKPSDSIVIVNAKAKEAPWCLDSREVEYLGMRRQLGSLPSGWTTSAGLGNPAVSEVFKYQYLGQDDKLLADYGVEFSANGSGFVSVEVIPDPYSNTGGYAAVAAAAEVFTGQGGEEVVRVATARTGASVTPRGNVSATLNLLKFGNIGVSIPINSGGGSASDVNSKTLLGLFPRSGRHYPDTSLGFSIPHGASVDVAYDTGHGAGWLLDAGASAETSFSFSTELIKWIPTW